MKTEKRYTLNRRVKRIRFPSSMLKRKLLSLALSFILSLFFSLWLTSIGMTKKCTTPCLLLSSLFLLFVHVNIGCSLSWGFNLIKEE